MLGQELLACLAANDALEVAHHHREGVGADHRADGVEVVLGVGEVFLKGAIDGFLERGGAARHGHQIAAQDAHLGDVGVFLFDIDLAHVDLAGDAHQCAGGGQCHAVLTGAGLGDHLLFAHELGQ